MKKSARFKRATWAFLVHCCLHANLFAQIPAADSLVSSHVLPELTIRERKAERTGYTFWKPDSLPLQSTVSLANRLLWEHHFDVRANGPGVLTTLSLRGAGPNRTPVFWNGLNLQSPMNGVIDASLVPLWPQDQLEVQQGGQSAALSSGSMGGSVWMEQGLPNYSQGVSASAQAALGSWGLREAGANIGWSGNRFSASARIFHVTTQNNFPFQKQGLDGRFYTARQVNNQLEKSDFQQFFAWKLSAKQEIRTFYWRQDAFRQLPPATTESPKTSWQKDDAHRALLTWQYLPSKDRKWSARLAYLHDDLAFHLSGDTDTSRSRQLVCSTDYLAQKRLLTWRSGVNLIQQWAQVDGYSDSIRWFGQTRLSAYTMTAWSWKQLRGSLLMRQEWAQAQASPFTASFGLEWTPDKVGKFNMHLARNFNLPTLNDRFWRNLGSEALRPEKGYSADVSWALDGKLLSVGGNIFHLLLDDWILWQPDASGLFRPGNLRKVWSRGGEGFVKARFSWMALLGHYTGRMQWSATTLAATYEGSEGGVGSQLAYTSKFSASQHFRIQWKTFSMAYLQQYTGKRLDLAGKPLPGFAIGTLLASHAFMKSRLMLEMRVENLWNANYEIIRYRPMPGRSWRIGLSYHWK
jgi:vitamin B12 transporter